ncbi:GGDEF domain-containing protein [Congregibacter litoralis]|uniref:diguanylate cyclase n=1 Tax=Congregibacter litoralis KT71 TaxID=314285 RepID=A4A8D6_9GAMM|nr:GGDEF domain-containing protein [Congregibacter litoralis]EAQ97931.2 diguanylate cyclase (GGDEF) domain protein [Congregibacter litoralis KT71]
MEHTGSDQNIFDSRVMRLYRRFGAWGLIVLVTVVAVLASLALTLALALPNQSPQERESGVIYYYLFAATLVPLVVAPLSTLVLARVLRSLEEAHRQVLALSTQDDLTRVANRRGFFRAVEAAFRDLNEDQLFLLGMVDLDRFKEINDTYGHLMGDRVLVAVAAHLRNTVDGIGMVGRLGGDEFAFFAVGSRALLSSLSEKIEEDFKSLMLSILPAETEQSVSASVGLTCLAAGETVDQALLRADSALYRYKKAVQLRARER